MYHSRFSRLVLHIVLGLTACIVVFPFLWMLTVSFSEQSSVLNRVLIIFPSTWNIEGYKEVFRQTPYFRWFLNSSFITILLTTLQLVFGIFAAYALSRFTFPGRELLFFLVLCTMMIPPQAIMLPSYMVITSFGWVNSYWGLVMPNIAKGYVIFMLRQFFLQIPRQLDEASQIDGCNSLQTLYHVYLVSALPAIISVTLIQFVRNWNDYYWALVVITEKLKLTLPVAIVTFRDETLVRWVPTMAAAVLSVIPVVLLYLFGQRYFLETNLASGTK
ncbi:carbohydrate ABC transporter permease [Sediminispirochaeta bajacaliforniensis]|uniref:carbohydrate ABC transporter permease n=1 Tax=Sediminispirochaeta bajacaliforniensis TaxID=148 RepID=UPI00036B601E|nr:carbohydrate ABC transporter permease [Sediminispirochaeta bajacaliforniensis]